MPERRAVLAVAADTLLHGVDVQERHVSLPGSSGPRPARSSSGSRLTFSSWSTFFQVNDHRNDPSVDGGPDRAEQRRRRAVPQHVHVIDAVRPGDHPGSQAGTFTRAFTLHR